MTTLERTQRQLLEKVIKEARSVAEAAANAALIELGVGESLAPEHLSQKMRDLRRRLRIHGRQLGDERNATAKTQELSRLVEEIAYEHWHRMLFARFLAENDLLMYPDPNHPVPITLEECEDLASERGRANGWVVAAEFAAQMLPQIFRLSSPVFEIALPKNRLRELEQLLSSLPAETFTASDSLGWVYQFWQAKRKEEVNASGVDIGARELPAVTQLFTEDYMVSFLLDNALGDWWAARRLSEADLKNARNEEELRQKAAIPGVPLEYLRFVRKENDAWTPAAGTFNGWPEQLADLKILDPCCGSGHFLVAALLMMVPMRMEMDGLTAGKAVDAVLHDNIHGLELDQRCVELAAFALALAAWKYPNAGGYRVLPELHLACSGLSVSVAREEWKQLGLGKRNLTIALDWMYDTFQDAPVLGSLLNPAKTDAAKLVQWDELSSTLEQALKQEQPDVQQEVAVVAQGLAKAAVLLSTHYQWVITNVPYKTANGLVDTLKVFLAKNYPAGKNALETAFIQRCMDFLSPGGVSSIVAPQNPLFLTSYKHWRKKLLLEETWHLITRLGPGAFETISGEVVKAILITLSRGNSTKESGGLFGAADIGNLIRGMDVSEPRTASEKASQLLTTEIKSVGQAKQLKNPDARIALEAGSDLLLMSKYAASYQGITTGDNPRFIFNFWETNSINGEWCTFQSTGDEALHYSGRNQVFLWENGEGYLASSDAARIQGQVAWDTQGVSVRQMQKLPPTLNSGSPWDMNCATIVPQELRHLPAIWCFCSSPEYNEAVRRIDQKLNVTNATLVKVPFDLNHWTKLADEKYPKGLPKPYTNDPTQWIFHGHPCGSVIWDEAKKWTDQGTLRIDEKVLQVAVARLLGHRWPAELDASMELADEQRKWVKRCEELLPFADEDGIVCVPSVRGEVSAADRLLKLLVASYGESWSNQVLSDLLKTSGAQGKTLDVYLREYFFTQHCKLFQHRPFIWQIWDGLSDGFSVLVNYHKFDHKLLETLIYDYLGDWISRQQRDKDHLIDGSEEKLAAAKLLKQRLELILEGENPYDIFARWKPLEEQPSGWHPDLNDGVRLNIRPFMTVPDIKKKGAGVLRDKPNIHLKKDRGADVVSAPWYHLGPEYGGKEGDRINDHHLSLAEKQSARAQSQD